MVQELDMIYLFGFSTRMGKQLDRLLPLIKVQLKKGTKLGIVFIHDGVIGVSTKGKTSEALIELLNSQITLYAMIPDLRARGIKSTNIHEKITTIEYEDLVDILESTPKLISWM
ncbi:MAG TPA: sulfurtransferase complex subunit TusB [Candidatus Lokiarchaeia archaeon]